MFLSENVRGWDSHALSKMHISLVTAIKQRNVDSVQSILKDSEYLCIDVRDEVCYYCLIVVRRFDISCQYRMVRHL